MPKVSRDSATQGGDFGPVTDRSDQLEDYTVGFTTFREDIDATPLLKGLPDDRCQCPHWGYVLNGKITFARSDSTCTGSVVAACALPAPRITKHAMLAAKTATFSRMPTPFSMGHPSRRPVMEGRTRPSPPSLRSG